MTPLSASLVPGESGVYAICAPIPRKDFDNVQDGPLKAAYAPLYIGQSQREVEGIRRRFKIHNNNPKPLIATYLSCYSGGIDFWYSLINDQAEIDDIETRLIEAFSPPCNEQGGPGIAQLRAKLKAIENA